MTDYEFFRNRLSSFLYKALKLGYDYNEAWSLLLESEQGRGILNHDYTYLIHFLGSTDAEKADNDIGYRFERTADIEPDLNKLGLLSDLIYRANVNFGIEFDDIFKYRSLNDFMSICENILGDYDDKIIKLYLLKDDEG